MIEQCTYNLTLRHFRKLLLQCKSNKCYIFVCVCVCVCACVSTCGIVYPPNNSYAPYCDVICGPLSLHHIFRHFLIISMIFGKNVTEHKICVLIFSTTFSKVFLMPRRVSWDIVINVETSSWRIPFILAWFQWDLNFLDRFLEKAQISGFWCDEAHSRFSQFCERA